MNHKNQNKMKTKFTKKIGRSIEETILRRQFDSLNPTTWPDGNQKIQSIVGSSSSGNGGGGGCGNVGTDPRVLESLYLKEKNKNSYSSSRMNTSSSGVHDNQALKEKELNEMMNLTNVFNDYNEQDKVNIMESLVKYTRRLQSRVNQLEATLAMNMNGMTYQRDIAYDDTTTNGYDGDGSNNKNIGDYNSYNNNDGGIQFINNNHNNNNNNSGSRSNHLRPITKFAIKKDLHFSEKDKIFMNQTALNAIHSTTNTTNINMNDSYGMNVLNDQDVTAIHSSADQIRSFINNSGGRRGAAMRDSLNSIGRMTPQGIDDDDNDDDDSDDVDNDDDDSDDDDNDEDDDGDDDDENIADVDVPIIHDYHYHTHNSLLSTLFYIHI